jgi:hypothetical protein
LELGASNSESEHELLLGGFSLGTFALQVEVVDASEGQACGNCGEGGPTKQGSREDAQPGMLRFGLRGFPGYARKDFCGKVFRGVFASERILQGVLKAVWVLID